MLNLVDNDIYQIDSDMRRKNYTYELFNNLIWIVHMQEEIKELKKRVEDFEQKYDEVQNESKARLKEAEESQQKALQLQETIER